MQDASGKRRDTASFGQGRPVLIRLIQFRWLASVLCAGWLVAVAYAADPLPPLPPTPDDSASIQSELSQPDSSSDPRDDPMRQLAQRLAVQPAPRSPKAASPVLIDNQSPQGLTPVNKKTHRRSGQTPRSIPASGVPNESLPLGPWSKSLVDQHASPQESPAGSTWVLNTIAALGVVIGAIFLLRTILSRAGLAKGLTTSGASPVIEVLSRVAVAPRNHVLLIRTGKRVLVVGDSSAGLRALAQIDDPQEVAGLIAAVQAQKPGSVTRSFGNLLRRFNSDYREDQRIDEEGADNSEHRVDRTRDEVSGLLSRVRSIADRGAMP